MPISPLNFPRVSNSLRANLATRTLTQTQKQLLTLQNQLSTGKRLTAPSDDPSAASVIAGLRRTLGQRVSYAENLRHAGATLSQVDSAAGGLIDILREAQTIASANVGSDVSADARKAASTVIDALYHQAITLANSQFGGIFLFGGDHGSAPFVIDSTGVRYSGADNVLENAVERDLTLPFTVNSNDVFGALSVRVRSSADLTPRLTSDTRLVDLRGATGAGVRKGTIILDNGADSTSIDLSNADTIGDIVEAINNAAIGQISATISDDGAGLLLTTAGGDTISISEAGGTMAADLGLLPAVAPGADEALVGSAIQPKITPFTQLSDLKAGVGIDLAAGFTLTVGTKSATIDLSTTTTVEGLINQINRSETGALARLNAAGTGIDILNPVQGVAMTISENGGTTAADLGLRSFAPESALSQLNYGKGVRTVEGADLTIARRDGTTFDVDIDGLSTIQQVIDAINTADNGGGVVATFAETGNGIVLTDSTGGADELVVKRANFSMAMDDLGLDVTSVDGVLSGRDVNAVRAQGLLGNLSQLRDALYTSDQNAITESGESLNSDLSRLEQTRGQVGASIRETEDRQERLEDQNVTTLAALSNLEDVDYNEAVTRFQMLQTQLQANLQTTGQVLNLSLLDFLS